MEQVIISTSRTEKGFSASCELLPGWVVAFTGDFTGFMRYVQESIDFYIDCAKADGDEYPEVTTIFLKKSPLLLSGNNP